MGEELTGELYSRGQLLYVGDGPWERSRDGPSRRQQHKLQQVPYPDRTSSITIVLPAQRLAIASGILSAARLPRLTRWRFTS